MSQNSLVLPTTGTVSGLSMTQDTNAALDTLNTLASGTGAPASGEAGQLWHDTTNNLIRILSLDSSSWIPWLRLSETLYLAAPYFTKSVVGSARNLVITQTGNATATAVAEEVVVETALGGFGYKISNFSVTLTASGNGANGLDTGSLAAKTFYALYAIYNPTTSTAAILATLSSTSNGSIYSGTNIPSGYTMSALIGFMLTNGSSHFVVSTQLDREVFYQSPIAVLSNATGVSSLTSVSLSSAVPTTAKSCSGYMTAGNGAACNLQVSADGTGTGLQQGGKLSASLSDYIPTLNWRHLPILASSQAMYWQSGNTTASSVNASVGSFTF